MAAQLVVDLFVSVDSWAGSDNLPGYFGYLGPELEEWIGAEEAKPQLQIMGRRTYEMLAGLPREAQDQFWDAIRAKTKVVFSRTLERVDWPNTRVCHRAPVDEIREMKATSSIPLRTVGSLSIARQLLDAGLVDRLRLMTFPLLAGEAGREPAFEGVGSADLALVGHRALDGRVLLLEYQPTGRDVPRT